MNAATRHGSRLQSRTRAARTTSAFMPLLVASASAATFIAAPADAVELGRLQIDSTLGQPLRASVAYALNPDEQLYDFCISLTKAPPVAGLPNLTRAKISVADGRILINGSIPIKEPLLAMQLTIDCPYTAHLSREFNLMLDPQEMPSTSSSVASKPDTTGEPRAIGSMTPTVARRPSIDEPPAVPGAQYRVQIGDTLSEIASRIENRPVGLWSAVRQIFEANPGAFIDGDINRLTAGYVLTIPFLREGSTVSAPLATTRRPSPVLADSVAAEPVASYPAFSAPAADLQEMPPAREAAQGPVESVPAAVAGATDVADGRTLSDARRLADPVADDTTVLSAGTEPAAAATVTEPRVASAQPGDVFVGADIPADAEIETEEEPRASVVGVPGDEAAGISAWLLWALGGGLALVAGLLVFGRGLRDRFGGGAAARPGRRATDSDPTATNETLGDIDFQFDDPLPGDVDMVLDADLGAGTGLLESDDMDVAQEFGFSATADGGGELDMVLPVVSGDDAEAVSTDIIPPQREESATIVHQEFMPDADDDGDYDLSMIVDATRQPITDPDGTAKELNAVQVDPRRYVEAGHTGLGKEIDLDALEQDYEDELTATQALNHEIEKAAMELALRMDEEQTVEMQERVDIDADTGLTAEMPTAAAENDDIGGDLDDTGINEQWTANQQENDDTSANTGLTANLPAGDDTATSEALTLDVDMNDQTVEMDIESGTLDTKKIAR